MFGKTHEFYHYLFFPVTAFSKTTFSNTIKYFFKGVVCFHIISFIASKSLYNRLLYYTYQHIYPTRIPVATYIDYNLIQFN